MVGGAHEDFIRAKRLLESVGSTVVHSKSVCYGKILFSLIV